MYMMLMLAKRGAELNALVTDNQWNKRMSTIPVDLYGKTVLVVGFGRIGTRSAKRCQAMEMTVLVYDPYVTAAAIEAAGCQPVTDLEAALPRPTSSPSTVRRHRRRSACSTPRGWRA